MKVLHIIPSLGGGGAERQLSYIAKNMDKYVENHIAFLWQGERSDDFLKSDAKLYQIPCTSNYDLMIIIRLVKLVKVLRPSIIQTWLPQMNILGGLVAKLTGVPCLFSERNSGTRLDSNLKSMLRAYFAKKAKWIVSNSESGNAYWKRRKLNNISVIKNGIPYLEIEKTSVPDKIVNELADVDVLVFCGRLAEQKNILNIMNAFEMVLEARTNIKVFIFGEGDLKNEVSKIIEGSSQKEKYFLQGFSTYIWSYLKIANVLVASSHFEGSPNIVLEAVAARCPVILSDIPEHKELLDANMATYVDRFSANSIASGINQVLESRNNAEQYAENAYKKLKKYSNVAMANQYVELYKKIVAMN